MNEIKRPISGAPPSVTTANDLEQPLDNVSDHGLENISSGITYHVNDLDRLLANDFDHGSENTSSGIVNNVDDLNRSLDNSSKSLDISSNEGPSQQQFKCTECGRMYKYKRNLKQHFSRVHPSKLPLRGFTFSW
jgi:hypothetical protein